MNAATIAVKAKPTHIRRKFEEHFFVPFSLKNCVSRLESRTEPTAFWVLKGQMRIQVDTWRVDEGTVGFQVYKAPKSFISPRFRLPPTRARGALFEQADGSTQVLVYAGSTLIGYLRFWVVAVILSLLFSVFVFGRLLIIANWLFPAYAIAVVVGMIAWSWVHFNGQHLQLLLIVENTLRGSLIDYQPEL